MSLDKGFPTLPEPVPLARFAAADDLRAAIGLWSAWLAGERRASAHTIAAYGRDLAFFLDFLTEHLGELPSLASMSSLRPADFRAYLARRAQDHAGRTSLEEARRRRNEQLQVLPERLQELMPVAPYEVELSAALRALLERSRHTEH